MEDGAEGAFKANFSDEGLAQLREPVKEKLREFMGYSDDTLVAYVVVMVRNGRQKDEVADELRVFLGDNNDTFVSWLWDHVSSNLHLYVEPKAVCTKDEAKIIHSTARGLPVHNLTSSLHNNSEPEAVAQKAMRIQPKREWGGVVRDQSEAVPLRSVIATVSNAEEKTSQKSRGVRQTRPPDMHHHRKRSREEGTRQIKRMSHQVIDAPRRLLQFAVRDAVRTGQPMTPRSDSASKRLRSVVSTMASDSVFDVRLQKINSGVRIPGTTSALRAAAEAAEDVLKDRYSESVFNRLGRKRVLNATEKSFDFAEQDLEREYEDTNTARAENQVEFNERNQYDGSDAYMVDQEADEAANPALDIDAYDDASAVRYNGLGSYPSTLSSSGGKESIVGYDMVQHASAVRSRKLIAQKTHPSAGPELSEKILSTSANKNTSKPLNHETAKNTISVEPQMAMEKVTGSRNSNVIARANDTPMTDNRKDLGHSNSMEAQKASHAVGSYATVQPEDGTGSKTVFISNVHFAATKDALSRHFNKFGAVLKTLILTDGVTGQPTGSAYIEFLHKESAEQALTLNGTSFMSRILKVVRKSSLEVPQLPGWSRTSRGSPFASRLIRTAYPRTTFPSSIRGRLPVRGGARSFQWKRDTGDSFDAGKPSQTTPITPGNQTVTPITRSFTYTRTEPKQDVGATATI